MKRENRRTRAGEQGLAGPRLLEVVAEAIPLPAVAVDAHGVVVHVNQAMRERGLVRPAGRVSAADFLPDHVAALGPHPWGHDHSAVVCRATPQGTVRERVWMRTVPGGACLIVGEAGPSPESEATSDQTARLASLGFMVAGTCHELGNPLSALYSMVQILRSPSGVPPEVLERGLANIEGTVSRLIEIARTLTDFSRVGDGEKGPVSLDGVVEEALFLARQHPLVGDIRFEHVRDPEAIVLARSGELRQVVHNIVLNAIQALSGTGRVTIEVRAGSHATIAIRDTGPGIDPAHLPRIFDPFFTTKPSGQGTGLGLAISNEIVAEHGGTLRAENNPDGGAAFVIQLPLLRGQPR